MKLIKLIFASLNINKSTSTILEPKDELVGLWENDLDDGSGLHAIWGWSFLFNKDGSGTYSYWTGQKLHSETAFTWSRISKNSIKAKYADSEDWTIIEYSLQIINAPYSGKLKKITDNNYVPTDLGNEGFWDCFGAIFQQI